MKKKNSDIINEVRKSVGSKVKNLTKEKLISNSKSRDGDWSNLNFKRIEFIEDKSIARNSESSKIKSKYHLTDEYIEKIFFDSLKNWQKKNLKNLTEKIYQEIIKEKLKNKLK